MGQGVSNHPLILMDVKTLKDFSSTRYGNVSAGQVLRDVPDRMAKEWNAHGITAPIEYETKVIREVPTVPGEEKPSSSSPADPAPQKTTQKKRGRKGGSLR